MPKYTSCGAIDLGSHNCRLSIARCLEPPAFKVVDAHARPTRLSENLKKTGTLSKEAMERTLAALQVFKRKIKHHEPLHLRCVATEACRRAENTSLFLKRVQEKTSLVFDVLSESEEAYYAALGVSPLLHKDAPYALVFDVGGASTEAIFLEKNSLGIYVIKEWTSLPLGVVNLSEDEHASSAKFYLETREKVQESLKAFAATFHLYTLIAQNKVHIIGSSGTATTTAALHLGLRAYDRHRVDGLTLTYEDISQVIHQLQMMPTFMKHQHPCIGAERAPLVLAGMAIFEGILDAWPVKALTVADRGVRDGLITEMVAQSFQKGSSSPFLKVQRQATTASPSFTTPCCALKKTLS